MPLENGDSPTDVLCALATRHVQECLPEHTIEQPATCNAEMAEEVALLSCSALTQDAEKVGGSQQVTGCNPWLPWSCPQNWSPYPLEVRALFGNGDKVGCATIFLEDFDGRELFQAHTNSDGKAVFQDIKLADGTYTISVREQSGREAQILLPDASGEVKPARAAVSLTLEGGKVSSVFPQSAAGFLVSDSGQLTLDLTVPADHQDRFAVCGGPRYQLRATASYNIENEEPDLENRHASCVTLRLEDEAGHTVRESTTTFLGEVSWGNVALPDGIYTMSVRTPLGELAKTLLYVDENGAPSKEPAKAPAEIRLFVDRGDLIKVEPDAIFPGASATEEGGIEIGFILAQEDRTLLSNCR